jgi:hypothetical protein
MDDEINVYNMYKFLLQIPSFFPCPNANCQY